MDRDGLKQREALTDSLPRVGGDSNDHQTEQDGYVCSIESAQFGIKLQAMSST